MDPQDTMATPESQNAGIALNPYAAPVAQIGERVDSGMAKAGRGQRLLAILIDSMVIAVPAMILAIALPTYQQYLMRAGGAAEPDSAVGVALMGALGILMIGYVAYQFYWLWKNGQTLGKKIMKIKIVRVDGSRASFPRIFFLRAMVPGILGGIPILGMLFSLADALFIFGEPKRCVHDYLADTIVINT